MITEQELWETTNELVKEHRDFIYESPDSWMCVYVWDGKPSCLVGQVLHKLGVSVDTLNFLGDSHALVSENDIPMTTRARAALEYGGWVRELQGKQDIGHSWGMALHMARDFRSAIQSYSDDPEEAE